MATIAKSGAVKGPQAPSIVTKIINSLRDLSNTLMIPALAILTAILVGSVMILLAGRDPIAAYTGLVEGAWLEPRGLVQSLLKTSPLILSGLAVGFAFKGGLFNIGAQGQLIIGSVAAAWAGYAFSGLPSWLHIILAMGAAAIAGALWGAIPGALKAYSGAHEVITTIMFNFIASRIAEWMISLGSADGKIPPGPLADPNSGAISRTKPVLDSARLPIVFEVPPNFYLNIGLFIAVAVAILIMLLVNRTTFGFELRMVGLNPSAAQYAGVNVKRMTISTMAIAGCLAGLAGAVQTLGINGYYEANQSLGLGFDSITVSLLASNNPIGIMFSAFMFGSMDQGTTRMQRSGVAPELILVIQALILMFIAAPQIIRWLYRVRVSGKGEQKLSTGWGQR